MQTQPGNLEGWILFVIRLHYLSQIQETLSAPSLLFSSRTTPSHQYTDQDITSS